MRLRERRTNHQVGGAFPPAAPATVAGNSIDALISAARDLCAAVEQIRFSSTISCVYNPLVYAWAAHEMYLRRFGRGPKRVVFLGMNPGPFGMVQTGVPFGEVAAVRDWLGIRAEIAPPNRAHARRPVDGFACGRSEVSGRRLWGLFASRFGAAGNFFREHLVLNYCPLAFVDADGRNVTPNKLAKAETTVLFAACDKHLRAATQVLSPEWLIGIGDFAAQRASAVFGKGPPKMGRILHPSPASPLANRDWLGTAERQLVELGVWRGRNTANSETPQAETGEAEV